MTLPATTRPDENATRLQAVIRNLRFEANAIVTECNTGTINLVTLANSRLQAVLNAKADIEALEVTTGIGTAYGNLYPNDTFTLATELTAIKSAIDTLTTYIETQIPQDGSGYLLITSFDASNRLVARTVSAATPINTLKGHAQAIVDLITVS